MKLSNLSVVLGLIVTVAAADAQVKTWTSTADFNEGVYFNTNSSVVPDALRLNQTGTAPLPFINIPAAGRQLTNVGWQYRPGRLIRINTETGQIVGEYLLTPAQLESSPSRGVVDSEGNCWVTNHYEATGTTAVTKIGVIIGGDRYRKIAEGVYIPDEYGEYVKDAIFTTGVDRDGDGYIRTSHGQFGNILAWNATAGKDLDSSQPNAASGVVQEAEDELILVFKRYTSNWQQTRSVAVDENDNIWIGYNAGGSDWGVHQLDKETGAVLRSITTAYSGYFLFYNNGYLITSYAGQGSNIINTVTGVSTPITGTDSNNFSVFTPLPDGTFVATHQQNSAGGKLAFINTAGTITKRIDTPGSTDKRGIVVGLDGTIWFAARGLWAGGDMGVYRVTQDGTVIKSFYTGYRPCGLGLDSKGNIWVTHIGDAWVTRINPDGDAGKGAIDGYVYIGTGSYNYSDGTGATTSVVSRDGEWRGTYDSFRPEVKWGRVNWDATVPSLTTLEVSARAANSRLGLNSSAFVPIDNNGNFNGSIKGRYIEFRVRMARLPGASSTTSPELRSLSVRFADGTISGTVGLGNWIPEVYPTADFVVDPAGAGSDILVNDVPLGPFGAYAFTLSYRGSLELYAKSSHWLRQKFPTTVNLTDNGSAGNVFALINGDIDEDNVVSVFDYILLSDAFDSDPNTGNWNPMADLDGDMVVSVFDYIILSDNFDAQGD